MKHSKHEMSAKCGTNKEKLLRKIVRHWDLYIEKKMSFCDELFFLF